jgi:hypothetical protein
MQRIILGLGVALIGAGALSVSIAPASTKRPTTGQNVFLLPPSDGYGVADCLSGERECGKIVANAWCESKGFRRALAYGPVAASDITGSVGRRNQPAPTEPPVMITCAE